MSCFDKLEFAVRTASFFTAEQMVRAAEQCIANAKATAEVDQQLQNMATDTGEAVRRFSVGLKITRTPEAEALRTAALDKIAALRRMIERAASSEMAKALLLD